jgi:hypothetical protein
MDANGYIGLGGYEPNPSYKVNVASSRILTLSSTKIGINTTPNSTYCFDLNAKGRIYNSYNNHIIFDFQGGYYASAIYPATNNTCSLGTSTKKFNYIYTYGLNTTSDARQKENIRKVKNMLDIVLEMEPVKYDLKKKYAYFDTTITDQAIIAKLDKDRIDRFGFLAQDLEEILPEVVKYDDSTDVYGIDYIEIIPVLVCAIQDQQEMIEDLKDQIKEKSATETVPDMRESKTALLQNRPNPFSENTLIEYSLAEDVASANLYIYDMNGTQLRSIPLHQRGEGSVEIHGGELKAGMYMYSMIADGRVIDTRTMVLTD